MVTCLCLLSFSIDHFPLINDEVSSFQWTIPINTNGLNTAQASEVSVRCTEYSIHCN